MTEFKKFPSIESFAHVYKNHAMRFDVPVVEYSAKVKIHGTNAGVTIAPDGTVFAQNRTGLITPENDNANFAAWVEQNKASFAARRKGVDLTIFGEWAGPGIQKKDAVTMLNKPYFFVFAAQLGDYMITSPKTLEGFIPDLDDVLVLPWHLPLTIRINYGDAHNCRVFADATSRLAEKIGEEDPFIAEIFDISGPGEGLVYMPVDSVHRDEFSRVAFKVKAERHRVKKSEKAASVKHEIPEGAKAFVEMFVTAQRVEQAVAETNNGVYDKTKMASYMKWMGQDIKKESVSELEEAGMEWKDVAKVVNAAAAKAFLDVVEQI